MLIKATAPFKIEKPGGRVFELEEGGYAELRLDEANRACLQGAAVPATMQEYLADEASRVKSMPEAEVAAVYEPPKVTSRKSKYNDADPAKE